VTAWRVTGALLFGVLAGCEKKPPTPVAEGVPTSGAPADAQQLASELFELIDRVADYRSSHEGRPPRSLRQLGVDTLTPATVRRLAVQGRTFTMTVVFRRGERRQVLSCSAGEDALEQAALNEGRFAVSCDTPGGLQGFEVLR
jgi:hypothetical protein